MSPRTNRFGFTTPRISGWENCMPRSSFPTKFTPAGSETVLLKMRNRQFSKDPHHRRRRLRDTPKCKLFVIYRYLWSVDGGIGWSYWVTAFSPAISAAEKLRVRGWGNENEKLLSHKRCAPPKRRSIVRCGTGRFFGIRTRLIQIYSTWYTVS